MNIPLNIFNTSLTVLTGLVIYAFYASCDPLSTGEINTDDEVHYFHMHVVKFWMGSTLIVKAGA